MTTAFRAPTEFKTRWHRGDLQLGIFTRLTTPEAYETLALAGLDVIVIDLEHGSFGRESLSRCLFAARAGGLTAMVRVPDADLAMIQHAIGAGAQGIIVPHVVVAEQIASVSRFVRTTGVERAYAGATRISHLRQIAWQDFRAQFLAQFILVAQIDEPSGVAAAQKIVRTEGIDAVFLGRIGLALAMEAEGQSSNDVDAALETVCKSCREHNLPIGMSLPDEAAAQRWRSQGGSLFVIDSDHAILLKGTRSRLAQFRGAVHA